MKVWKFILIVGICRIPGIMLTVMSGDAIVLGRYGDIAVIILITAALYGIGVLILRMRKKRKL